MPETLAALFLRSEYGPRLAAVVAQAVAGLEGSGLRVRVVDAAEGARVYVQEGKR